MLCTSSEGNPIGAGDIDGNKGEILNLEHTISEGWNLSMRPLQWACHNVSCECEFNQQADIRFNDIPGSTGRQRHLCPAVRTNCNGIPGSLGVHSAVVVLRHLLEQYA